MPEAPSHTLNFTLSDDGLTVRIALEGPIVFEDGARDEFLQSSKLAREQGAVNLEAYINTPGGSTYQADMIANEVKCYKGTKTALLGAICMSAGTYVCCFFDKVIASSNTTFMIHNPSGVILVDDENKAEEQLKHYKDIRKKLVAAYVAKTGLNEATINDLLNRQPFLTAEQAKMLGFIDEIVDNAADYSGDLELELTAEYKENSPALLAFIKGQLALPAAGFGGVTIPSHANKGGVRNEQPFFKPMTDKQLEAIGLKPGATDAQIDAALADLNAKSATSQVATNAVLTLMKAKGCTSPTITAMAATDPVTALKLVEEWNAPAKENPQNNGAQAGEKPEQEKPATQPTQQADNTRLTDFVAKLEGALGAGASKGETLDDYEAKGSAAVKTLITTQFTKYAQLYKARYGAEPVKADIVAAFGEVKG